MKHVMGERRGVYWGFNLGNLRETDHLENPGVDETIILRYIFRKWNGRGVGTDWIDVAQDRNRWGHL